MAYSSTSSRRSHMMPYQQQHHQHQAPQTIFWSPTVPSPPSHLFATYFPGYGGHPDPHMRYYPQHHSHPRTTHGYPPNPMPSGGRRGSTGDGPRMSPHILDPPPPPPSHNSRSRRSQSSSHHSHHSHGQSPASVPAPARSILKNNGSRVAPPQTPYVLPRARPRGLSFSSMKQLLRPRTSSVVVPDPRRVRFNLPPDDHDHDHDHYRTRR